MYPNTAALCSVQCSMCSVQSALCIVQCALSSMHCALCIVQCAVCNVQSIGFTIQFAVSGVQCLVCSVRCVRKTENFFDYYNFAYKLTRFEKSNPLLNIQSRALWVSLQNQQFCEEDKNCISPSLPTTFFSKKYICINIINRPGLAGAVL